jgi:hypothetical protein
MIGAAWHYCQKGRDRRPSIDGTSGAAVCGPIKNKI